MERKKYNKDALIRQVSKRTGYAQYAIREVIDALLDIMLDNVLDGGVNRLGYITFGCKTAAERRVKALKTGEIEMIPEREVPFLRLGIVVKRIFWENRK